MLTKPKVLVVDANQSMRKHLMNILGEDYQVADAIDGCECLAKVERFRPDLVLLDFLVSEVDATEICNRLKQGAETLNTKIILLVSRVDEQSKARALGLGVDDFVTKPFSQIELLARLNTLYRNQQYEKTIIDKNTQLSEALSALKLTQTKLVQSEKINALGRMSAGLLHELNNPLNYASTALQLLKRETIYHEDKELQQYIDDIYDGVKRVKDITSDVKSFTYPSKTDVFANFNLQPVIDSAQRFTETDCVGVNMTVELSGTGFVFGSESQIQQVLVNLIRNAAQAIHQKYENGGGEIKIIGCDREDFYHIDVYDNGSGIQDQSIPNVFDPFFTTKEVGEGMGLGLSICSNIIRSHSGKLTVESAQGEWTKFTFNLPVGKTDND